MKRPLSKAKRQRLHAKKRARQRYDLDLNRKDLDAIVKQIQSSTDAFFIKRSSQRVTLWYVIYNKIPLRVVYDKDRKNVVTFLPWKDKF